MAEKELIFDIVVETNKAVADIKGMLAKTEAEAKKSGSKAGNEFVKGIKGEIANLKIDILQGMKIDKGRIDSLRNQINQGLLEAKITPTQAYSMLSQLESASKKVGSKAGNEFVKGIKGEIANLKTDILQGMKIDKGRIDSLRNQIKQGLLEAKITPTEAYNMLSQLETASKKVGGEMKNNLKSKGSEAGNDFGNSFKSAITTILGAISFDFLKTQINNSIGQYDKLTKSNVALSGAIKQTNIQTRNTNSVLASNTASYEERATALGISTDSLYVDAKATQSNEGAIKSQEASIKARERAYKDSIKTQEQSIFNLDKETEAIDSQIKSLNKQTNEQVKQIKLAKGYDIVDKELTALEIQKNQLEIQKDTAQIAGDNTSFINAKNQIAILDVEISLRKNKIDAIDFETDAIKDQAKTQEGVFKDQKDILLTQIQVIRTELSVAKNKFDIDIEPAKRKLEDLQATNVSVSGGKVMSEKIKKVIDEESAKAKITVPIQINEKDVNKKIDGLFNNFKGAVSKTTLTTGFADFFRSGITDIDEISKALEGYVDIAVTGKSEFVSLDRAVSQLTEQFRSERAALGETAGLTDEYISQILPRGLEMLQAEGKLRGKKVDDLTKEERAMAKLKGLTENFNIVKGSFTEQEKAGLIEQEKFASQLTILQENLGKIFKPLQILVFEALTPFVKTLAEFVEKNPEIALALTALVVGFAGVVTVFAGLSFLLPVLTSGFTLLSGAVGLSLLPIVGITLAVAGLVAGIIWAYQNVEWFRNLVNSAFKKIVGYVMWAKDNWVEALGQIIGFMISLPVKMVFWTSEAVSKIIDYIKKVNWNDVWSGLGNAFANIFSAENLKKVGNGVMDFIRGIIRGIGAGIPGSEGLINSVIDKIPKFAKGGDFIVPDGYPNDSYLMRVQSRERVIVQTPAQQNQNINSNNNINYNNYGNKEDNSTLPFMLNYA